MKILSNQESLLLVKLYFAYLQYFANTGKEDYYVSLG